MEKSLKSHGRKPRSRGKNPVKPCVQSSAGYSEGHGSGIYSRPGGHGRPKHAGMCHLTFSIRLNCCVSILKEKQSFKALDIDFFILFLPPTWGICNSKAKNKKTAVN